MESVPEAGGRTQEMRYLSCLINCTIAGKRDYADTEIQKLPLPTD